MFLFIVKHTVYESRRSISHFSKALMHQQISHANTIDMSRPKVLITRPDIPSVGLNLLQEQCETIIWNKPEPIPRNVLLQKIKGVDAVYCLLTDKIDEEILNAAGSQLKVVASMSVGIDHLDLHALKKRGIKVGYTPGILTNATAELAVGLLLATSRRLLEANRAIYQGEWKTWSPTWMCGPGLSGATVGIVGLGRIGVQVARCLKGFNVAEILYTSRSDKPDALAFNGKRVNFDQLLGESDFIVVTTALTPETRGMFNHSTFNKMKKSAIFVNVSRGEVVDQAALIEALKQKIIKAAGLDVMTPEPIPLDSELLKLDNCVILPHIGSATTDTRAEMSRVTANNILAVLRGTPSQMPAELQI